MSRFYSNPKWKKSICSIKDCDRRVKARGLCLTHYHYMHSGRDLLPLFLDRKKTDYPHSKADSNCNVARCPYPKYSKGLCSTHYNASRKGEPCSFAGCKQYVKAKGYCAGHYVAHRDFLLRSETESL